MNKKREDFNSEYEWLVNCAEHGASDLQLHLAFKILMTRTDQRRVVEAYKWVFISNFLGNPRAENILTFIQVGMTDEQLSEANAMIDSWIQEKQDESLQGKTTDWTQELKIAL
jgi:hypothetical protein